MALQTGALAEAYVYFRLLSWGYNAHFASGIHSPFDLWVEVEGHIIKIQVKGTASYEERYGTRRYCFTTSKGADKTPYCRADYDILAMVAVNSEAVYFTDKIPGKRMKIAAKKFHEKDEKETWRKTIDRVLEGKENVPVQRKVRKKPRGRASRT